MQTVITKPTKKNDKKDPRSIMEIFQEKKKILKKIILSLQIKICHMEIE